MSETDANLPLLGDPPANEDRRALADTQPIGDPPPQDTAAAKPAKAPKPRDTAAAKPPKAPKPRDIAGLVLVDIPAHGLKCGDYVTLPAATAKGLQASGEFDPQAPRPE